MIFLDEAAQIHRQTQLTHHRRKVPSSDDDSQLYGTKLEFSHASFHKIEAFAINDRCTKKSCHMAEPATWNVPHCLEGVQQRRAMTEQASCGRGIMCDRRCWGLIFNRARPRGRGESVPQESQCSAGGSAQGRGPAERILANPGHSWAVPEHRPSVLLFVTARVLVLRTEYGVLSDVQSFLANLQMRYQPLSHILLQPMQFNPEV